MFIERLMNDLMSQQGMNGNEADIDEIFNILMDDANKAKVPQVKIKCEDEPLNDCTFNDRDILDDMSPFSRSGVSSPASSCGAMSGPGSPGSPLVMEHPPPPPYSRNYLTPESALFAVNPSSPTSPGSSIGSQSPTYSIGSQSPDPNNQYKYDPRPLGRKKRRNLVPDEKKTQEYWERRKRNNIAARRSREERRNKELQTFESMKILQQENMALKQTVNMLMKSQQDLQDETTVLKQLLEQSFKV